MMLVDMICPLRTTRMHKNITNSEMPINMNAVHKTIRPYHADSKTEDHITHQWRIQVRCSS